MQRTLWFAFFALTLFACGEQPLRGTATESPDGGTYLIVAPDDAPCNPVSIDGVRSKLPIGVPIPIQPGVHELSCTGDGIQFEINAGTTFTFDYWGP